MKALLAQMQALIDELKNPVSPNEIRHGWTDDIKHAYFEYFKKTRISVLHNEPVQYCGIIRSLDANGISEGNLFERVIEVSNKMNDLIKVILITGASSGIGAALAREYAATGVTLHLLRRNSERLQAVANDCRSKGATVRTAIIDVTDKEAMQAYIEQADAQTPLDLVIANAGISAGTGGMQEPPSQVEHIFNVNVNGVLNTVQPAAAHMVARKGGHIAIISSLAGMRALPSCPAYSASKAAVRYYGDALRGALHPHQVMVSVVCPGYIHTPMTAVNDFWMPFVMSAERAARVIRCGLNRRKRRIAFPLALYWPLCWLAAIPTFMSDVLFRRLPAKAQKT